MQKKEDVLIENELVKAFYDTHPVRKGNLLIVPESHFSTHFDVPRVYRAAMDDLRTI
ncbi:HIT domain-containing protein [Levilactobacillus bambusae]|uniref:HIT domain-containing protein n=1 Tax=Levilactobacillus bambusae TaxID=2024736 RepID=UPI001CDAE328|nr:HIT domain-containing protein [Levilactobacillus bambusae]